MRWVQGMNCRSAAVHVCSTALQWQPLRSLRSWVPSLLLLFIFLLFCLEAFTLHTFVFQTDRGIYLGSMDLTLSLCFPALNGVEDGLQRRRTEHRGAQEQGAWPGAPQVLCSSWCCESGRHQSENGYFTTPGSHHTTLRPPAGQEQRLLGAGKGCGAPSGCFHASPDLQR